MKYFTRRAAASLCSVGAGEPVVAAAAIVAAAPQTRVFGPPRTQVLLGEQAQVLLVGVQAQVLLGTK